ncbi:hypothetical protein PR048_032923 [Dryococelus australis]|uniref:ATPase V1 complex subunit H C-terminal domain-containing protein n=1 Tax=Dryococelus australis TaxID=614101 RepID=A0ABQ9G7R2_9NEOP|nr:hypothetical protein PR048_032923 [Dryococelus australis]
MFQVQCSISVNKVINAHTRTLLLLFKRLYLKLHFCFHQTLNDTHYIASLINQSTHWRLRNQYVSTIAHMLNKLIREKFCQNLCNFSLMRYTFYSGTNTVHYTKTTRQHARRVILYVISKKNFFRNTLDVIISAITGHLPFFASFPHAVREHTLPLVSQEDIWICHASSMNISQILESHPVANNILSMGIVTRLWKTIPDMGKKLLEWTSSLTFSPRLHKQKALDSTACPDLYLLNNEYMQSVARCLQMMLRIDEYRFAFVAVDGISTLLAILSSRINFQIQYQLVFCLWVLTFNPLLAEKMNKFNVIPILADILSDSVKEKVTRIILAVFRNLIEKPEDAQVSKEHCIAMVQCKVLKQLSIFEQRKLDDEDIVEDIDFLNQKLQASVQDLSSFDEYATEIKSGRLEWSPVHKSAKFWRENASRLNEKNYELLRILIHLLETSKDTLVLSVASFDIGEYVRHYPRGKDVIEQLGGKQLVMQLLAHEDPNVRYEALLAVQKLMVHNWLPTSHYSFSRRCMLGKLAPILLSFSCLVSVFSVVLL